jgi:transposase
LRIGVPRAPTSAPKTTPKRGRPARRPGHNLLIRLRDFKNDVLRFVSNFAVPFSNNQAEQDIRMMKVKMKISGGFRTKARAETFAILRSVILTARKQGWNILKTLSSPTKTLIGNLTG